MAHTWHLINDRYKYLIHRHTCARACLFKLFQKSVLKAILRLLAKADEIQLVVSFWILGRRPWNNCRSEKSFHQRKFWGWGWPRLQWRCNFAASRGSRTFAQNWSRLFAEQVESFILKSIERLGLLAFPVF